MRVGVIPIGAGGSGGVYQYSLAFLAALAASRRKDEFVLISWDAEVAGSGPLLERGALVRVLRRPAWRVALKSTAESILGQQRTIALRRRTRGRTPAPGGSIGEPGRFVTREVASLGLDLIVELGYTGYGLAAGIPFAMPIHDIQHRLQPEFPEVGSREEWVAREAYLTKAISLASMILVDSDVGRTEILEHYGAYIGRDRISVLPFVPAPYLTEATPAAIAATRDRYRLPDRYLLFPAQFWPHKNHLRVIEALATRECGDIHLTMTGGGGDEHRDRTLANVQAAIAEHRLERRTQILGHVPDADMAPLYCGSAGVILPTFFGPTNIPVVEAWSLGIPVLTSDIAGIREQAGSAAILVDPRSVDSVSRGLAKLWHDEVERERLIAEGRSRGKSWTKEDFADSLADVFDELERRLLG